MTSIRKKSKPLSEQPTHLITYVDNSGNMHSFKSSEKLLKSHKILMQGNPYIKSFKVKKGV
jgi:hypothetical protein